MTPEQAFALLEQEPWRSMLETYKQLETGGSKPMVEFRPQRSGWSAMDRALAAWRLIHRPDLEPSSVLYVPARPRITRRDRIRTVAKARKRRRGWR